MLYYFSYCILEGGGGEGGRGAGGANGKEGSNVRKCVGLICEVLLALFFHLMCCNCKEKINKPVI